MGVELCKYLLIKVDTENGPEVQHSLSKHLERTETETHRRDGGRGEGESSREATILRGRAKASQVRERSLCQVRSWHPIVAVAVAVAVVVVVVLVCVVIKRLIAAE